MISNQVGPDWYASFGETFTGMVRSGELEAFKQVFPKITTAERGQADSLDELFRAAGWLRPNIVLVATPNGFGHEPSWVRRFLKSSGDPAVLHYEADPWGGLGKRVNQSMAAWLSAADVVFSVAREPHLSLFARHGANDIRFIPHTYCPVTFRNAEEMPPDQAGDPSMTLW